MKRLRELAKLASILPSYINVWGKATIAPESTLLALLELRGIRVRSDIDVSREIDRIRAERSARVVEPVTVCWHRGNATRPALTICAPDLDLEVEVEAENGDRFTELLRRDGSDLRFQRPISTGYYTVRFALEDVQHETFLIVAPQRGWEPEGERAWGVFIPPYAPARSGDFGAGDVSHLKELGSWAQSLGGTYVSTLPLGPTFLEERYNEASPYAGISRLLWNELYTDLNSAELVRESPSARRMLESDEFQNESARLRQGAIVDHVGVMQQKRRVFRAAAEDAFRSETLRSRIETAVAKDPLLGTYARFRATHATEQRGWSSWASGTLLPIEHEVAREYLVAQLSIREQMRELSASVRLYLDFPLGTHSEGFDSFVKPSLFLQKASAGAPPDHAYSRGQSWGFPPIDPEEIRKDRYSYFRDSVRHHLSVASMLRIDHVMGLHRLYVVPPDTPASAGAYIRYRSEEMYAVLTLESHRAKASIIGEDLGTVPDYVRKSIDRRHFRRLFVVQRRILQNLPDPPGEPVSNMVASLNTHDMYPFRAWWEGSDIPDRRDVGLLDDESAEADVRKRDQAKHRLIDFLERHQEKTGPNDAGSVVNATMSFLARSKAAVTLVNIEDLWLEENPQNIPTTTHQRPNWRRRLRLKNEEIVSDPNIRKRLEVLNATRQETGSTR